MMRALKAALLCLCCLIPSAAWAQDEPAEIAWGESAKASEGSLGEVMAGSRLRYKIMAQGSGLEASDVKIELLWLDTIKQKDASQVIIERTSFARLEQYKLEWVPAEYTLNVSYNCPTRRGDSETLCTERWLWKGGARRFKYIKTTSNNPLASSQDEVIALIRAGKLDQAQGSIKALRERYGDERVSGDAFFVAYFEELVTRARGLAERGQGGKAAALIAAFIAAPPVTSTERCPDKGLLMVCLEGRPACGCNDPFGQLPATERSVAQLERAAGLLVKEGKHAQAVQLLRPALDHFPDRPRLLLALADAAWGAGDEEDARGWYKKYVKLQSINKAAPVVRAVQRAEAPKD
jgi:tetratricopeptide (TPR) repeat protein